MVLEVFLYKVYDKSVDVFFFVVIVYEVSIVWIIFWIDLNFYLWFFKLYKYLFEG